MADIEDALKAIEERASNPDGVPWSFDYQTHVPRLCAALREALIWLEYDSNAIPRIAAILDGSGK